MAEGTIPAGVTEVGEFLAAIATAFPVKTRTELIRMLSHSVAAPSPQEVRQARLGLLSEMVKTGWMPGVNDYEAERKNRLKSQEKWPGSSSLVDYHGTWASAVEAAFDIAFSITPKRSKARGRPAWPAAPYSRQNVLEGLDRCSEKVGRVITQWEYLELRRVERQLAIQIGLPDPRLPQLNVVKRHFGGWDQAIDRTKWRKP